MEIVPAFEVREADGERPGALAAFPFDRDLIGRFRESFPRARWREDEAIWFVPGVTARRRIGRWIERELAALDRHADERGRDAFAFEPWRSPYLEAGADLLVRTPYSRIVVETLRQVPFARWDGEARLWRVPYRSLDALRRLWPGIEAAALEAEPEARRRRRAEIRAQDDGTLARAEAERRRRRYPVRPDDPPPLGRPVAVHRYGIVLFEGSEGELVERGEVADLYPHLAEGGDHVWARWRLPDLDEVNATWPARETEPPDLALRRGWWRPSREELNERRRLVRTAERARRTRAERGQAGTP